MRAVRLAAFGVQVKGVFLDEKASVLGDFFLAPFYFFVEKFFDPATIDADQVVVVLSGLDFKHGLAGLEMVAFKEAGLLELGQNAIYRRQSDIDVLAQQQAIHIVSRQVAYLGLLEKLENLQARACGLEAHVFQIGGVAHALA